MTALLDTEPTASPAPRDDAAAPANDVGAGSLRYRAFISYCHRDDKVAAWLHKQIETYRVPRSIVGHDSPYGPVPRRLGKVFRDEEELGGAAELGPQLQGALRDSAALIVICSMESAKSYWVEHEIRYFKQINPDRPVLAVIANGCPGKDGEECFPQALRHHVDEFGELNLDRPAEPLAPDLTKLDKDVVKLKLIAGLLGVGYDELARRDLKRERRRLATLGTLAVTSTIVFAGLAVAALTYARMAENRAWLAQQSAEVCRAMALPTGDGGPIILPPAA